MNRSRRDVGGSGGGRTATADGGRVVKNLTWVNSALTVGNVLLTLKSLQAAGGPAPTPTPPEPTPPVPPPPPPSPTPTPEVIDYDTPDNTDIFVIYFDGEQHAQDVAARGALEFCKENRAALICVNNYSSSAYTAVAAGSVKFNVRIKPPSGKNLDLEHSHLERGYDILSNYDVLSDDTCFFAFDRLSYWADLASVGVRIPDGEKTFFYFQSANKQFRIFMRLVMRIYDKKLLWLCTVRGTWIGALQDFKFEQLYAVCVTLKQSMYKSTLCRDSFIILGGFPCQSWTDVVQYVFPTALCNSSNNCEEMTRHDGYGIAQMDGFACSPDLYPRIEYQVKPISHAQSLHAYVLVVKAFYTYKATPATPANQADAVNEDDLPVISKTSRKFLNYMRLLASTENVVSGFNGLRARDFKWNKQIPSNPMTLTEIIDSTDETTVLVTPNPIQAAKTSSPAVKKKKRTE